MIRLPGAKRIHLGMQWVRGRTGPAGLILGYHRVATVPYDPFALCVPAHHLAEQLDVLARWATPISLEQLWAGLQQGNLPPRAVAVTFDDGYVDVLNAAAPLLTRYNIPATVFVTSGSLGQPFWWDVLAHLILSPGCLPAALELEIKGNPYQWSLTDPRFLSLAKDAPSPRRDLLSTLYQHLLSLSLDEREQLLIELRQWSGCPDSPTVRSLTPDELVRLHQQENITIGAHTVTHPRLPDLLPAEQQAEIQESKQTLEQILAHPITMLSYPHGQASPVTRHLTREAGFALACTSENGVVWRGRDPYRLPRFWMPDWDGETFARWLKRWIF